MNQKEIIIFVNKKLAEISDPELVSEINRRIENNSVATLTLIELFKMLGRLMTDKPELYLKALKEWKNN